MKKMRFNPATRYIVIICSIMLSINIVLGVVLLSRSGNAMRTLIGRHMLSVADVAAASLDGDSLASLTADDVGSPEWNQVADTLTKVLSSQKDDEILYIYTVKKSGDIFVFTVDPDPEEPAAYGDPVVYTPEEDMAWLGVSTVEKKRTTDQWGSYYTAWSPVRNSAGEVIGLVGVDFSPEYYDSQNAANTRSIIIGGAVSILIGTLVMLLMLGQLRRRLRMLDDELRPLSDDVQKLTDSIRARLDGKKITRAQTTEQMSGSDVIKAISDKLSVTSQKLKEYMQYAHDQAYTDSMTGVGNKAAYLSRVKEIDGQISAGAASFAILLFDINGLKNANDNFGHECGDRIIIDTASLVSRVFGKERVFRIGGDEFIAIMDDADENRVRDLFERLEALVSELNRKERLDDVALSFSWGKSFYRPGMDSGFKEVFKRADEAMYQCKLNYYQQRGDVRQYDMAEK